MRIRPIITGLALALALSRQAQASNEEVSFYLAGNPRSKLGGITFSPPYNFHGIRGFGGLELSKFNGKKNSSMRAGISKRFGGKVSISPILSLEASIRKMSEEDKRERGFTTEDRYSAGVEARYNFDNHSLGLLYKKSKSLSNSDSQNLFGTTLNF